MHWIGDLPLEICGVNHLVDRFRVTYLILRNGDDGSSADDLESIITELRQRPPERTSPFYGYLEEFMHRAAAEELYELASLYRDMLHHYLRCL